MAILRGRDHARRRHCRRRIATADHSTDHLFARVGDPPSRVGFRALPWPISLLRERAETALRAAQTFNPGVREPFTVVEIAEAS